MIQTDICIIGAGPVGLFAVFEAGLSENALPPGRCFATGWRSAYRRSIPKNPFTIFPGFPEIQAQDADRKPVNGRSNRLNPPFSLGERVTHLHKLGECEVLKCETSERTRVFIAKL
jgi:thioredoxin reductase (NADPH)